MQSWLMIIGVILLGIIGAILLILYTIALVPVMLINLFRRKKA